MKNQRLRQARKATGLSRNQLAILMHKSPHTIKSWETTARQPRTLREVERLCDLLGITVTWYLTGQPPMKPILPSEKEKELLALFSELTDEQKEAVLEIMKVMVH